MIASFLPLERLLYRFAGIDPEREQPWPVYALSLLAFSAVSVFGLYVLQRVQGVLPLNPTDVEGVPPALAFNTAVSFVTNTNWQNYGGEGTMSHLTQMVGLTVQNFVSASVGIAVAIALVRGLVRRRSETIGNFWVDLIRTTTRVLLPLAFVVALLLVSQGVVQTLRGPATAQTLEGATQEIYRAPIASQEAIKELGTNGGGIANANSAHPFENPTGFTEPRREPRAPADPVRAHVRLRPASRQPAARLGALRRDVRALARLGGDRDDLRGRRQPADRSAGSDGGGQGGALRRAGLGALCGVHDRHLDGRRQRGARQLHARRRRRPAREHDARRGLAGRGRRGPLRDARLRAARGLPGRPDGRANAGVPRQEDPGVGDEARRLYLLVVPALVLGFSAVSVLLDDATASILNPGPHGLTEIVYAFTSAANNNGSAFGGLTGNTDWYNTTLGLSMLGGRFLLIVTALALAGSLARKQVVPADRRHVPHRHAALHRAAARRRPDRGRPHLLPDPRAGADRGAARTMRTQTALLDPRILRVASVDAVRKLDPRVLARNPVMFVVEVGSVLVTVLAIADPSVFAWLIAAWLWFTVLFANLAEAIAEGRGKAQAEALRRTRSETLAHRRLADGSVEDAPSSGLAEGDVVVVAAGELIPADGEVIEGIASVDESAITGESAPVIRESGGDRSAVTGGTRVLSDRIVVRVTQRPGESFLDRMIALVEGSSRQKTPNEIALSILLSGLTIIFLLAVVSLQPFAIYSGARQETIVLVALLVCLIPTTIGALLSAIGIAGMDRLVRRNVLALSGRAVEAAGDCSTLLLDKTGTITLGNRQAAEFLPLAGVSEAELADAAQLASLADETPEGRSIVVLAKERFGLRERELAGATLVAFSAETRMSGVDLAGRSIRKGAGDAIRRWVAEQGGTETSELTGLVEGVAAGGGTPLVVAENGRALGVVHLKDVVKEGMSDRFDQLRALGIRTVMITGDNPLTARAIAEEAGVDDFLAEATPEQKLALIRSEQAGRQSRRDDRRRHERRTRARAGGRRRRHEHRDAGRSRGGEHGRPRLESDEADRDRGDREAAPRSRAVR